MGEARTGITQSLADIRAANRVLTTLKSLSKDLASIMDDLHTRDGTALPVHTNGTYTFLPQPDLNSMLQKAGNGCLTWNTFALQAGQESYDTIFSNKITSFVAKMEASRSVFPKQSTYFEEGNSFRKMSGVAGLEGELHRLRAEVKENIAVFKKKHNRYESHRSGSELQQEKASLAQRNYSYLVEIRTTRVVPAAKALRSLDAWIECLCDRSLIDSLYQEKIHDCQQLDRSQAIANVQASLELEILWAYTKQVDLHYIVDEEHQALIKRIRKQATLNDLGERDKSIIHALIQADINAGRRVFISLSSATRKGKIQALSIRFVAASIALLASLAQACIAAYAMAQVVGFSGAGLGIFLQGHPAALAAVLLTFFVMLAVNFAGFERSMSYFLKTAARKRLLKRPDGEVYCKKKKIALIAGLSTAALIAIGVSVMGFNGSQAAFSAIFSLSPNAPAILAIAAVTSLIYFVTTMSFATWLSKLLINHWAAIKRKCEHLFMVGRRKEVKAILLVLASVFGLGVLLGAITAVGLSLDTWVKTLAGQVRAISHTQVDKLISAVSLVYYCISRLQSNRNTLTIIHDKIHSLRVFFKQHSRSELAKILCIGLPIRIIAEATFFAVTICLMVTRLFLEGIKVLTSLVLAIASPITSIGIAIVAKIRAQSFKECFRHYLLLPQMASDFIQTKVPGWQHVYLYCLKRAGPLSVFYNMSVMKMRGADADAVADNVKKGTQAENPYREKVRGLGLKGYLGGFFMSENVKNHHAAPIRVGDRPVMAELA